MQSELFSVTLGSPEQVRKSPGKSAGLLKAPIVSLRKSGAGLSSPEVRESPTATNSRGRGLGVPVLSKFEKIRSLEVDLGMANKLLFEIQNRHDALKGAFGAAHNALLEMFSVEKFRQSEKASRKRLYDARFQAGVAWNPTRKKYQELLRWKHELVRGLQTLNSENEQ